MQRDGNLVIYRPGGQAVWSSGIHGNPVSRLVVQGDGNGVIYRPDGQAIWATRTVQRLVIWAMRTVQRLVSRRRDA